jgi:chitinase
LQANAVTANFDSAVENYLSAFVSNIMTVVNTYGYDGVDIDWEPDSNGWGFVGDTTAAENMTALGSALRTALGSKLLITAALASDATYWGTAHSSFDRINVMTYDMGGGSFSWYNSPLYVWNSMDSARYHFLAAGVPASKLALGLAFYGWKWTGGVLDSDHNQGISGPTQVHQTGNAPTGVRIDYSDVLPLITQQNYTWDNVAVVPYINYLGSSPSTYWYLTYDNPQSIQAKVQYIIARNLGGWIIWHLGGDYVTGNPHPHPLLDAVQAGSAPAVLSTSALSSGTVGTLYSASLSATGAAPLQWSLSSGRLPSGLSLSSTGVISGAPTTAGTFAFVVTVGNFAGSSSQSFTITIAASG